MSGSKERHQEWEPISGSTAELYPMDVSNSCMSSNPFVVRGERCMVVIDPGTQPDQLAFLSSLIHSHADETGKPVLVMLTHCHHDHSKGVKALPMDHPGCFLVMHRHGARAMLEGDGSRTASYIFNEEFEAIKPDIMLFHEDGLAHGACTEVAPGVTVTTEEVDVDGPLLCQRISLSEGEEIEVYHTPGHSDDSITIRVGHALFLGDLLFAIQPGVAGIVGWNCEQLADSAEQVAEIIRRRDVEVCLNGHGQPVEAGRARAMLLQIAEDARTMHDVAVLDDRRQAFLKEYSQAAMGHITNLLTILSGQLYALSFELNKLDDTEQAAEILERLNIDAVDDVISIFSRKTDRYLGDALQTMMPIKSYYAIRKLRRLIGETSLLQACINPALPERIGHAMEDLVNAVHGYSPGTMSEEYDLHEMLRKVICSLQEPAGTVDELVAVSDDAAAFSVMLARKLALRPPLEHVEMDLALKAQRTTVLVDYVHAIDFFTDWLEGCATAQTDGIEIQTEDSDLGPRLLIALKGSAGLADSLSHYLQLTARLYGWELTQEHGVLACVFKQRDF